MPEIQLREALRQAMTEEMERDENVFLMGEEVGEYNGAYKVSEGMLAKFGPRRVFDTPISEAGFSGLGVGAAMTGLRPIIEYMSWSFSWVAMDQLVNNAANVRYMSGGQFKVPIVFRGGNGIADQLGQSHQDGPQSRTGAGRDARHRCRGCRSSHASPAGRRVHPQLRPQDASLHHR